MRQFKSILDVIQNEEEGRYVLQSLYLRLEPIPLIGCHVWLGWNDGNKGEWGHGKFRYKNVPLYVHRTVWELENGRIDPGLVLDHKCQIEACCIGHHLEPVTIGENTYRGPGRQYQFRLPSEYPPFPYPVTERELDEAFTLKDGTNV